MPNFKLLSPVQDISHIARGVGAQLKYLGIKTIADLLFYFPSRYDDLSKITPIKQARLGERVVVRGRVELIEQFRSKYRRKLIISAVVADQTGAVRVSWFGQPWIIKILKPGDEVYLVGEIKDDGSGLCLQSPVYERVSKNAATHAGRIVPVYASTEKLSQKQIRFLVRRALPLTQSITDPLPPDIKQKYALIALAIALEQVHFPQNEIKLEQARTRLKFDELFRLQIFAASLKRQLKKLPAPEINFQEQATKKFVKALPFQLTDDQRKASWEIIKDLGRARPMNRLLEGDVGSGKTVVVAIAALNAVLGSQGAHNTECSHAQHSVLCAANRGQVAIMAPTEILARQHFNTFSKFLVPMGIKVGLWTSSGKAIHDESGIRNQESRNRKNHDSKFIIHDSDVLIGTHALIQEKVKFKNLVLVVVDEQHRFGVEQRKALKEKRTDGQMPHLLTLTATPIPRSLALVFYGDLDISILRQMPKGRQKIETILVHNTLVHNTECFHAQHSVLCTSWARDYAYEFVRTQVKTGHQVFWTCPIIDPSDTLGVKAATEVFENLKMTIFKDLNVGLLHGRMKPKEREKTMGEFLNKKIDILVATPVIEVGIDVPNATVMVIEGAERFGLAQLHQFRGRVGRGEAQSYCILFVEDDMAHNTECSHVQHSVLCKPSQVRFKAFLECQDGFDLAEKDLALRGPGEMYGTAQTGFPEFKIATFADVDIAKQAKQAAEIILQRDPELQQYPELKQEILAKQGKAHLE